MSTLTTGQVSTAAVLGARYREGLWLIDEYRNDRRKRRLETPEIVGEIVERFTRNRSVPFLGDRPGGPRHDPRPLRPGSRQRVPINPERLALTSVPVGEESATVF